MRKEQYIVVAESSFAKIFKTGTHDALTLVHTIENPEGRQQPGELDADRQGVNKSVDSGVHGMSGDQDSHEHDVEQYAKDLCHLLQREHQDGKFTVLQIAAGPHLLGVLRKNLSADCQKVLAKTVNKNLIHSNETEILAHFA